MVLALHWCYFKSTAAAGKSDNFLRRLAWRRILWLFMFEVKAFSSNRCSKMDECQRQISVQVHQAFGEAGTEDENKAAKGVTSDGGLIPGNNGKLE